jgi:hypothetical protein
MTKFSDLVGVNEIFCKSPQKKCPVVRGLDLVGAACWCAFSIPRIREIEFSGHPYFMPDVGWSTILLKQNFTFFLFVVSLYESTHLLGIQANACRDSVSITMPFAAPHINVRGVWHVLVKFALPFVSSDATVMPVNMTIHMKGCIACEHHSPVKEKLLSSSISFIFFPIG